MSDCPADTSIGARAGATEARCAEVSRWPRANDDALNERAAISASSERRGEDFLRLCLAFRVLGRGRALSGFSRLRSDKSPCPRDERIRIIALPNLPESGVSLASEIPGSGGKGCAAELPLDARC